MNSPNPSDKKNPPWRAVSQICGFDVQVACVAGVSNRVRAGAKKEKWNGEGEGRRGHRLLSPSPLPSFLFLLSSQLSRRTRAETVATQANVQGSLGSCGREADSYKKSLRFQKYTDSGVWTGPSNTVRIVVVFTEKYN